MRRRLAIWGAGGHGRSVAAVALSLSEYELVAFFDEPRSENERLLGVPVESAARAKELVSSKQIEVGALGYGNNFRRSELYAQLADTGLHWPVLVHPTAWVAPAANIGPGSVLMANAVVNVAARIGAGCIVNSGAIVEHDSVVGDFSAVSPGASIASNVVIGSYVFIGIGASVRGGVRIGDRSVIGAGAAVVKDVTAGVLAVGVPARETRRLPDGWSPV